MILRKIIKPDSVWKTTSILGGRGAVGIIIATYSLSRSFITPSTYSIIILATILISIVTSSLIKFRSSTSGIETSSL